MPMPMPTTFAASANINLSSDWTSLWNPISSQLGPLTTIASWAGVLIVVAAVVKWAWDRKKGMPGRHGGLLWALVIGALLAAPGFVIPLVLGILDTAINVVFSAFGNASGG